MFEKKLFCIQTKLGEMIVFTTDDSDPLDDTNEAFLLVEFPATLMPREGGQLGFQMSFPFSDYDEPLQIRKADIVKSSLANGQIKDAYKNWKGQVKATMSGIVVPNAQVANPGDLRPVS
jgi:hypothetical protein